MKQCPECSAQYDDNVKFCAKDGRSLRVTAMAPTRLCPHCANSIAEDAVHCPYCKADVGAEAAPEWLIRDERSGRPRPVPRDEKTSLPKIMLMAGIALCVFAAALFATGVIGKGESGATRGLLDQKIKELQAKDERLKVVEAELAKARQEADASAKEGDTLKARLEDSQKARAAADARLSAVNRELERRSARRAQAEPKSDPRSPERVPDPTRPVRRSVDPGLYETTRATEVHEQPAASSRVISRIGRGTRINVVRSEGDWLEVVSRRGNPSGFILRDDTMFVTVSN
jgi:hypothetical protein